MTEIDTEEMPAFTAGGTQLPPVVSLTSDPELLGRFYSKIRKNAAGCWIWKGAKDEKGYGFFAVYGKTRAAHRVSYAIAGGRWASPDRCLLHSCDNPSCVNPAHLREGTIAENNREIVERGHHQNGATKRNRHALESGTEKWRNGASTSSLKGRSRLSEFDVKAIRTSLSPKEISKDRLQALAEEYEVRPETIRAVVLRKSFAWVF